MRAESASGAEPIEGVPSQLAQLSLSEYDYEGR